MILNNMEPSLVRLLPAATLAGCRVSFGPRAAARGYKTSHDFTAISRRSVLLMAKQASTGTNSRKFRIAAYVQASDSEEHHCPAMAPITGSGPTNIDNAGIAALIIQFAKTFFVAAMDQSRNLPSSIYDATERWRCSFQRYLAINNLTYHEWAENRLADFNLWAAGVGASTNREACLDTRLSDEPGARQVVISVLVTLEAYVKQCARLGNTS